MSLILYGILLAHLNAYRNYYANIGITFAITYVIKRLVKSSSSNDHADLIGLGGYTLTIGEFVKLLQAMKQAGFKGNSEETSKIVGGMLGEGVDIIKDLITKKGM
jgi:hypothetical protein